MIISVTRKFTPVDDVRFEPMTAVVWTCRDGQVSITPVQTPDGYVNGLLDARVDGEPVALDELDRRLEAVGYTRERIEREIASRA